MANSTFITMRKINPPISQEKMMPGNLIDHPATLKNTSPINDPEIMQKSSGSLEVDSVSFTYVLVNDKEDNSKASYVPAWYFQTTDKKLKNGEQHVTYSHVINAIDGSDLKDTIR